jgi:hypothetical protein
VDRQEHCLGENPAAVDAPECIPLALRVLERARLPEPSPAIIRYFKSESEKSSLFIDLTSVQTSVTLHLLGSSRAPSCQCHAV